MNIWILINCNYEIIKNGKSPLPDIRMVPSGTRCLGFVSSAHLAIPHALHGQNEVIQILATALWKSKFLKDDIVKEQEISINMILLKSYRSLFSSRIPNTLLPSHFWHYLSLLRTWSYLSAKWDTNTLSTTVVADVSWVGSLHCWQAEMPTMSTWWKETKKIAIKRGKYKVTTNRHPRIRV